MASSTSKHTFEFLGKADSLTKASKQAQKELTTTEKAMGKVGDVAKYALAGVGVAAVGSLVKASVDLAVQAEDAGTKFEAVFAENVPQATEFVEEFANKAGFAEFEMQSMLATSANVAQGLGATGDEALTLSTDLATLAGDVASFNGATSQTPEVLAAMQSALTGERDALKTYGIVIDEADVNTQAFIETGKTQADQLTKIEKAQATYTLMVERAGEAVGDLDATSDSTSNQMAKMQAEFKDVQVQLGTGLIPVLTATVGVLGDLTDAIFATASETDRLENNIVRGVAKLAQIADVNDDVADSYLAASEAHLHFNSAMAAGETRFNSTIEALIYIAKKGGPDAAAAVERFAEANGINTLQLEDAATAALGYSEELDITGEALALLTDLSAESTEHVGRQGEAFDDGTAEAQRFAQIGLKAATDATEDLTEATEDATSTLQAYLDKQRAAIDPLFAFTQATRDLEEAERAVDEARRDSGRGSDEHVAAMEAQATAYLDVKDASEVLRLQGLAPTKEAFLQIGEQAGLTDEQMRLMQQQWDLWDPASKRLELIQVGDAWTVEPGGNQFAAEGGRFQRGDVVMVGEEGPEVVRFGAAGTVIPNDKIPTITGNGHAPTTAAVAPVTNEFHFHGPVFGVRDLQDAVIQALETARARGRTIDHRQPLRSV